MQVLVLLHLVVVCFVGSRCEAQDVFKYDQPSEAVLTPEGTIRGVRDRELGEGLRYWRALPHPLRLGGPVRGGTAGERSGKDGGHVVRTGQDQR